MGEKKCDVCGNNVYENYYMLHTETTTVVHIGSVTKNLLMTHDIKRYCTTCADDDLIKTVAL